MFFFSRKVSDLDIYIISVYGQILVAGTIPRIPFLLNRAYYCTFS